MLRSSGVRRGRRVCEEEQNGGRGAGQEEEEERKGKRMSNIGHTKATVHLSSVSRAEKVDGLQP